MKTFWLTIMAEVFLLLCTGGIQAQEAVAASGGNAAGSGGTVSFTAGQAACSAIANKSGTITQGVQQPFEIFIITSIEENEGISLRTAVSPNPASNFLKLTISDYNQENITYQLFDINGRLMKKGVIIDKETVVQTGNLAPAEYYLKVIEDHKELRTFKIIKK